MKKGEHYDYLVLETTVTIKNEEICSFTDTMIGDAIREELK